jgi:hypothetical protein
MILYDLLAAGGDRVHHAGKRGKFTVYGCSKTLNLWNMPVSTTYNNIGKIILYCIVTFANVSIDSTPERGYY